MSITSLSVVVVGAHPGDPEYGCGGTIARLVDRGDTVTLLYLTTGADYRVTEARDACSILGAEAAFVDQEDGHAVVDETHADSFAGHLDRHSPQVVLTHWPVDHHADHRAAAALTHDAWNRLGRRFALHYYEVSPGEDTVGFLPDGYVDISGVVDRKQRACDAHASQNPQRYQAMQDALVRERGADVGVARAEAYRYLGAGPRAALPWLTPPA